MPNKTRKKLPTKQVKAKPPRIWYRENAQKALRLVTAPIFY